MNETIEFPDLTDFKIKEGFVSSIDKRPPFKELVEIIEPWGQIKTVMYHENESDGYDFENESPLHLHLINVKGTFYWRTPKNIYNEPLKYH